MQVPISSQIAFFLGDHLPRRAAIATVTPLDICDGNCSPNFGMSVHRRRGQRSTRRLRLIRRIRFEIDEERTRFLCRGRRFPPHINNVEIVCPSRFWHLRRASGEPFWALFRRRTHAGSNGLAQAFLRETNPDQLR